MWWQMSGLCDICVALLFLGFCLLWLGLGRAFAWPSKRGIEITQNDHPKNACNVYLYICVCVCGVYIYIYYILTWRLWITFSLSGALQLEFQSFSTLLVWNRPCICRFGYPIACELAHLSRWASWYDDFRRLWKRRRGDFYPRPRLSYGYLMVILWLSYGYLMVIL